MKFIWDPKLRDDGQSWVWYREFLPLFFWIVVLAIIMAFFWNPPCSPQDIKGGYCW